MTKLKIRSVPRRRPARGEMEFSFTKVFFILFFIAAGWAIVNYAMAYYATSTVQNVITADILENRDHLNIPDLSEKLRVKIRAMGPFRFKDDDLIITQTSDGSRAMARLKYIYPVAIPLIGKTWDIEFTTEVDEALKRKNL